MLDNIYRRNWSSRMRMITVIRSQKIHIVSVMSLAMKPNRLQCRPFLCDIRGPNTCLVVAETAHTFLRIAK